MQSVSAPFSHWFGGCFTVIQTAEHNTKQSRDGLPATSADNSAGTTSFHTPGAGIEAVQDDVELLRLQDDSQANLVESISQFLAKPRIAGSVALTPALSVGSPVLQGLSWTLTSNDSVFSQKVFGFSGISYTTHIRLQVNSNPFQQGRLKLCYYPNPTGSSTKLSSHFVNRITISQLPGIEMNINDTAVELAVPFTSYERYIDVTGTVKDPLFWNVTLMSPLVNGPNATTVNANVTVWIWYTDVKLYGASNAAIVPQSGRSKVRVKTRQVSEQEEKPLSSWLSSASKVASDLSAVPSISAISGPTSLFLDGLSGVASYFGYSRPVNGEPVRPMAPHYHNALPNSDGLSPASVLSLRKDAKVKAIVDFSPSSMDEMSINFVKRQWSYFDEFTWATSATIGSQLYKRDLNLGYSATLGNGVTMAPLTFLSNLLRFYRGGIEIMFKLVKTGFHSGSLAISCQYGTSSGANYVLQDTDPLHRTIIDIQEGTEFCILFPFIHGSEYLETFEMFGTWYVHVVNALVCPETVNNSITVQLYVRGADDMEFSTVADGNFIAPIVTQGGDLSNDDEITCEPVGGAMAPKKITGLQAMSSVSDTCTSLLQLLKYGTQIAFSYTVLPTAYETITFNPWGINNFTKIGAGATTVPPAQFPMIDAIRACYAYTRGSFEITAITSNATGSTSVGGFVMRSHIAYGVPGPVTTGGFDDFSHGYTIASSAVRPCQPHTSANKAEHGLGSILPYRCRYRASPTMYITGSGTLDETQSLNFAKLTVSPSDPVLLRVGDDFQCLYWVGVPVMTTNSTV